MAELYQSPTLLAVPSNAVNPVPEGLKKKVARNLAIVKEIDTAKQEKAKRMRKLRHDIMIRTYGYEKAYRDQKINVKNLKRQARLNGGFYREDEPRVMFVIRIKGINKLAPKPRKVFQLFRLRQLHNGVFMRINKATTEMLKYIEPFVTYGYLSRETIRRLVYKRGYGRVGRLGHRCRVRLQTIDVISDNLGQYGIHSIEDIINEIYTCGPHFKQVNNFLWPFKLSSPRKGFVCKRHGFSEPRPGDWGNREDLMNELINRMN